MEKYIGPHPLFVMVKEHKEWEMNIGIRSLVSIAIILLACAIGAAAQQETYTGTVVSYGNGLTGRMMTGTFTLTIDRYTSDQRAQQLLGLLQEGSDETLLSQLDKEDVGRFSINGRIGPRVNVVRESMVDGRRRIFAVFRRWMNFGEIRGGYRSTDYPYGVIELYVDPRTGKGEGTYVAAARIRWNQDKKTGQNQVEIENFATYPARLLGVTRRGGRT
jgi:hypothetical protein